MLSDRIVVFLLLSASILNLLHVVLWSRRSSGLAAKSLSQDYYSYRGHDYPELLPLPHPPQRISLLMEETVHYSPLGSATDAEWLSLTSPGFGYVRLGPENRTFVVTMFHELHCLRMLNLAFAPNMTSFPHVKHCLNYLRQGILCSPDLALEPGDFETQDFEVERTLGVHECKDWAPIYDFVARNYEVWSNETEYAYTPPIYGEHEHA